MIRPSTFLDVLKRNGVDTIVGLPCSSFSRVLSEVECDRDIDYIRVTSEAEAVGVAAGVWLGGRSPAIMLQNSGFCDAINPICSLLDLFAIPVPFFVSVRGGFGVEDEPQHRIVGGHFCQIVESLGLRCAVLSGDEDEIRAKLQTLCEEYVARGKTVVAAVPVGTFADAAPSATESQVGAASADTEAHLAQPHCGSRSQVLAAIRGSAPPDCIYVCSTGFIGRDLFALGDAPTQLYVAGSMGCASSIGFGLSRHTDRTVIVLDGDGAALMRMGNCATIANGGSGRLLHVVLNNGAYESTGGQSNYARQVDFAGVAKACGYSADSTRVQSLPVLSSLVANHARAPAAAKPVLLDAYIAARSPRPPGRPGIPYPEQAIRLRQMLRAPTAAPDRPSHAGPSPSRCGRTEAASFDE